MRTASSPTNRSISSSDFEMTKNRSASGVPITGREPYTLSSERLDKTTIAAESGDRVVDIR